MRVLTLLAVLFSTSAFADTFVTYGFLGATYHGLSVDEELADEMPNKLTDDGKLVYHPRESILKLETPKTVVFGGVLHDCFDETAYILGVGPSWQMGETWSLGLSAGAFMRDKHFFIDQDGNRAHTKELPLIIDMDDKEIAPFIFGSVTKRWFIFEHFGVETSLVSNFVLTHAELGVFARL